MYTALGMPELREMTQQTNFGLMFRLNICDLYKFHPWTGLFVIRCLRYCEYSHCKQTDGVGSEQRALAATVTVSVLRFVACQLERVFRAGRDCQPTSRLLPGKCDRVKH